MHLFMWAGDWNDGIGLTGLLFVMAAIDVHMIFPLNSYLICEIMVLPVPGSTVKKPNFAITFVFIEIYCYNLGHVHNF